MLIKLDNIDQNLLNIIQAEFPLGNEPFALLGQRLSINGDEVIRRISRFKAEGIVRLIGPVLNTRRIGYQTTLIAMKIRPELLDKAAQIIIAHPQVSHCYQRDHDFNFWFTLAAPARTDLDKEVQELGRIIKSDVTLNLPAVKMFKIGTFFNLGRETLQTPSTSVDSTSTADKGTNLSSTDRAVINELQQGIPLRPGPFDFMSKNLHMDTGKFLSHCRYLMQRGIIRRYSASINHTRIGFVANAMSCWKIPANIVNTVGKKMATFQEISHCYERQVGPGWPYNMFAMMHAMNKKTCQGLAHQICAVTGLNQSSFILLFSTREFKKTRIRYQV